jgi:hypothetical protein
MAASWFVLRWQTGSFSLAWFSAMAIKGEQ